MLFYDKSDLMEEEKLPAGWRPAIIIKDKNIDDGKESDWDRTSGDYAKFRDIYTDEFDVLHYAAVADLRVRK